MEKHEDHDGSADEVFACSRLDFSCQSLFELPGRLLPRQGQCMDVGSFSAAHNYLCSLPIDFASKFPMLQILDLRDNHFRCIPSGLQYLRQLQELVLSSNKLHWLQQAQDICNKDGKHVASACPSLSRLRALHVLALGSNRIESEELSHIHSIPCLRKLDLCNNNLRFLPSRFLANCKNLRILHLGGNPISSLPRSLMSVLCNSQLVELSLQGTCLKQLPKAIGKISTLRVLDLSCNELSHLPSTVLHLTNLVELYLDRNMFANLPQCIYSLHSLQRLSISFNPDLEQLTDRICCLSKIEHLTMDSCSLQWIPSSVFKMKSLVHLSVSHNRIYALPFSSSLVDSGLKMELDGNPLDPSFLSLLQHQPALAKDYFLDDSLHHKLGEVRVVLRGSHVSCTRVLEELSSNALVKKGSINAEPLPVLRKCILQIPLSRAVTDLKNESSGPKYDINVLWPCSKHSSAMERFVIDSNTIVVFCVDVETIIENGSDSTMENVLDMLALTDHLILVGTKKDESKPDLWDELTLKVTQAMKRIREDQILQWNQLSEELHQCDVSSTRWELLQAQYIAHEMEMLNPEQHLSDILWSHNTSGQGHVIDSLIAAIKESTTNHDFGPEHLPAVWGEMLDSLVVQSSCSPALPMSEVISFGESFGLSRDCSHTLVNYFSSRGSILTTTQRDSHQEKFVFTELSVLMSVVDSAVNMVTEQLADHILHMQVSVPALQCSSNLSWEAGDALLNECISLGVLPPDTIIVHGYGTPVFGASSVSRLQDRSNLATGSANKMDWLNTIPNHQSELTVLVCIPEENLLIEDLIARCTKGDILLRKSSNGYSFQMASFWQALLTTSGGFTSIQLRSPMGTCLATWRIMSWILEACSTVLEDYLSAMVYWPCPCCVQRHGSPLAEGVAYLRSGLFSADDVEVLQCPRCASTIHRHSVHPPEELASVEGCSLQTVLAAAHAEVVTILSQEQLCHCADVMKTLKRQELELPEKDGVCPATQFGNGLVVNAGNNSTIVVVENATIVPDDFTQAAAVQPCLVEDGGMYDPADQSQTEPRLLPAIAAAPVSPSSPTAVFKTSEPSHSFDEAVLDRAVRDIAKSCGCDAGLVWQVVECIASNEWSDSGRESLEQLAQAWRNASHTQGSDFIRSSAGDRTNSSVAVQHSEMSVPTPTSGVPSERSGRVPERQGQLSLSGSNNDLPSPSFVECLLQTRNSSSVSSIVPANVPRSVAAAIASAVCSEMAGL